MSSYKTLNKQVFTVGDYSIVPIRKQDRNEQQYHLRQNKPLTKESQDEYFKNVVAKLFNHYIIDGKFQDRVIVNCFNPCFKLEK